MKIRIMTIINVELLYRVKINNNYSVICTYVDVNTIHHSYSNNTVYSIQKANRKASSTGHPVNKIWKKKIE